MEVFYYAQQNYFNQLLAKKKSYIYPPSYIIWQTFQVALNPAYFVARWPTNCINISSV